MGMDLLYPTAITLLRTGPRWKTTHCLPPLATPPRLHSGHLVLDTSSLRYFHNPFPTGCLLLLRGLPLTEVVKLGCKRERVGQSRPYLVSTSTMQNLKIESSPVLCGLVRVRPRWNVDSGSRRGFIIEPSPASLPSLAVGLSGLFVTVRSLRPKPLSLSKRPQIRRVCYFAPFTRPAIAWSGTGCSFGFAR